MMWRTSIRAGQACLVLLLGFAAVAGAAKKKPPAHPINVNTASAAELQQVPGIGPSTAEKILQARKSYGSFRSVDDLMAIRGIGPKRLEKMRKYLTVSKPATRTKTQTTKSTAPVNPAAKSKAPTSKAAATKALPAPNAPPGEKDEEEEP